MKILILKPSSLGDVIHALPVLRLLKQHHPKSEIHWWLEGGLLPLLEGDPDITRIFGFPRKNWFAPKNWKAVYDGVSAMQAERFDIALDLQGLARSGIAAWLANAETVVGLDNPREGAREGAQMYYDVITPPSPLKTHAVDRYLNILRPLGVPIHDRFDWMPRRQAVADRVQDKWNAGASRWISLLPGARWDNKRWPVENFSQLVRELSQRHPGHRFVVIGGKADEPLGLAIARANPDRCLQLAGKTDLQEMIEWMRLSELVITNDTGPMHIAAALRRPVLALFGPTNPDLTGPYGQRQHVMQSESPACIPCMKSSCAHADPLACLKALTVLNVAETAGRMLAR